MQRSFVFSGRVQIHILSQVVSVLFLSDLIIMYRRFSKYPAKILSLIIELKLDLVPDKEKESF